MFLHLTELQHHPIHFDLRYAPGEIDFGPDVKQVGPLQAKGMAELLANTLGEIRITGKVEATLTGECVRCLEEARLELSAPMNLFYRPAPRTGTQHPEVRIDDGEDELGFYEKDGLELEEALREHVLLQLPMELRCQEDCQGLCPGCGVNRNRESCGCRQPARDLRWAALSNIQAGKE